MTEFVVGKQFLSMPMFLSGKRCLLIISAAYIQLHVSLDLMEANNVSNGQTAPRVLSQTTYTGYLSTKAGGGADYKCRDGRE